jgi:hypothetical protein
MERNIYLYTRKFIIINIRCRDLYNRNALSDGLTLTKRSDFQIHSLILVFRILIKSLIPKSHNIANIYQWQKSATEHSTTCKSRSHKPQQA